ncbi:hypothetical protein [Nocardia sp. AG03]|uniref:WXG100 family type VII secretion target n=1 Tax=Nocardia sp. AG03 TaxID=3025312 RepID=UPI0024182B85|nr:hypothetical protein [Nocardia sp. AG03]
MSSFSVELSDLRGWGEQVGRAGHSLEAIRKYAVIYITDADFGRILEQITYEYGKLVPVFHEVLSTDSTRMLETRQALLYCADEYQRTDHNFASAIAKLDSQPVRSYDDGVADGFIDVFDYAAFLANPVDESRELPLVDFTRMQNKVCDLIAAMGPDPREYLTKWIAGDIGTAAEHGAAWRSSASSVEAIRDNLRSGQSSISRTWTGEASGAEARYFTSWDICYSNQATAMRRMGDHVIDAIDEAVKMAQVIVDVVKTVISLIGVASISAAVPVVGQVRLARSIWDGITMLNNARKVMTLFFDFLRTIKDFILYSGAVFSRDSLPASPTAASS